MKQLIPKEKQKLYYIKWQDAHHNAQWLTFIQLEQEVNREMLIVEQIGWVVYEDNKEIHVVSRRLTSAMDGGCEYGMYQRIPKAWIMKKRIIISG